MSLFDQQGILKSLLRLHNTHYSKKSGVCYEGNGELYIEADKDMDEEFEDDVYASIIYSLIKTVYTEETSFEMYQLVQLAIRRWLKSFEELERWKQDYIRRPSSTFLSGKYENWAVFKRLFSRAKAAMGYQPGDLKHLILWATTLSKSGWYARATGTMRSRKD